MISKIFKLNGKKKKIQVPKLRSKITFSKKIAKSFSNTAYYIAAAKDARDSFFRDCEKFRLSTPKWDFVSDLFDAYNSAAEEGPTATSLAFKELVQANKEAALSGTSCKNRSLLRILSKTETLVLAYRRISRNKGNMTQASFFSKMEWDSMDPDQKELALITQGFPDGMSIAALELTGFLIIRGRYPWGVTRRIYIDKPGTTEKRPISIPPFMDRVVQQAILMVLEAIYEPYFEKQNRAFGFRPCKGTHDAISALQTDLTNGMLTSVEGDIKGAYNNVKRPKLLDILSEKIEDRQFLKFIEHRLNYKLEERKEKGVIQRVIEKDGIPQGGIDSPYLWNIYMLGFDEFVLNGLGGYISELNTGLPIRPPQNEKYNAIKSKRKGLGYEVPRLKKWFWISDYFEKKGEVTKTLPMEHRAYHRAHKEIRDANAPLPFTKEYKNQVRFRLFSLIKPFRLLRHSVRMGDNVVRCQARIRIFYLRYADDWIILTNGNKQIGEKIKRVVGDWLLKERGAILSEAKTLVTDIRKDWSRFLGFAFKMRKGRLIRIWDKIEKKIITRRVQAQPLVVGIDKQRIINKFHMKGLCSNKGFPREMPGLSCMEPQVIIERFNSILRGITNYYADYIDSPSRLTRWIYIIRFCCIKTLAQKYKMSIKKVFKKYGVLVSGSKTIEVKVVVNYGEHRFYKDWTLLTYKELVPLRSGLKTALAIRIEHFWDIEKGRKFLNNPLKPVP